MTPRRVAVAAIRRKIAPAMVRLMLWSLQNFLGICINLI